jgi:hypothetical protein
MSDQPDDSERGLRPDGDPDTDAILARRGKFIARALGALSLSAAAACAPPAPCLSPVPTDRAATDATDSSPQPCLTAPPPDAGRDAGPQPCLDVAPMMDAGPDAAPMPCLTAVRDAGDTRDTGATSDAAPMPCLTPVLDAGQEDATPAPCLRIAPTDGG